MEIKRISFQVIGKIVPKQRPRVTRYGTYTPQPTLDYEALIAWTYRSVSKGYVSDKPLQMSVKACFQLPKKTKNSEGDWCMKNTDLDNVIKVVCDGLNKVAYLDDKQIVEIRATKKWASKEYIEIEITEVINEN